MAASFLERVIEFLKPIFSYWGYIVIFLGTFLESFFLTSWAAPGTVILLLGGLYSAQGDLSPLLVGVTAFAGAAVGDLFGYFLGVRGGHRLLHRYADNRKVGLNLSRAESYFRRYGGRTLFLGKWVAGIKAFIPIMAGVGNMPVGKFVGYTVAGNVVWTGSVFAAGYFFGESWRYIDRAIGYLGWGLLVIVIVAVASALAIKRYKSRRRDSISAVQDDRPGSEGG